MFGREGDRGFRPSAPASLPPHTPHPPFSPSPPPPRGCRASGPSRLNSNDPKTQGLGQAGNPPFIPEKKGKRHFSRELPTPCMGPGGAARACPTSKAALKFLEQGLVQRRIGNRLHRFSLLRWEVSGPERGWVGGGQGLQPQTCSARPRAPPHRPPQRVAHRGGQLQGDQRWVSKTQGLAWQTLEGRKAGQHGGGRQSAGREEKPSSLGFGYLGSDGQL